MTSPLGFGFDAALSTAASAAGGQNYPQGTLFVVATPIGNLADITLRALHVLAIADVVACEDTRHTQTLLRAYGIDKRPAQMLAVHQHNELEASQIVVNKLQNSERIAYVSDAGTPAISDPGARLVAAVRQAGLRCIPLPGASSITSLLSVAGVVDEAAGGFVFTGFLPTKAAERAQAVDLLALEARATVLLEAPHRIDALARALSKLGERRVTLGRELTKQFEEIVTLPAQALAAWLDADANRGRGEFALVVHPQPIAATQGQRTHSLRILKLLMGELPLKTAVKLTADISGESRNVLYDAALALKNGQAEAD